MPYRPACLRLLLAILTSAAVASAEEPVHETEDLFPMETWHAHASCIVETPQGDLLVCWFRGSGERKADDVKIEGARLRRGSRQWSARFVMADAPDFPDGNPCLFIDPQQRLWLLHTTIMANTWESALLKVRISSDYQNDGPPRWQSSEVLHVKPGPEFDAEVARCLPELEKAAATLPLTDKEKLEAGDYLKAIREH